MEHTSLTNPEVHIGTPIPQCREYNTKALNAGVGGYYDDLFENLVFRYEEPNGMSRWDSPLFTVASDDSDPPGDAIWAALFDEEGKARHVRPNAATVLKPATESNYLYELDRITQEVVRVVQEWVKDHVGEGGGCVSVPGTEKEIDLPVTGGVSLPQLQRLRRAFIGLNRVNEVGKERIRALFVDYLNDAFQQ